NAGREERGSALWGTTKRDGQTRGSALWGNGGRGSALLLTLLIALVAIPLAAAGGQSSSGSGSSGSGNANSNVQIPDALLNTARANPDATFPVIVQGNDGEAVAELADQVAKASAQADKGLTDEVNRSDDAVRKARDNYANLLAAAQKARADATKAQ